MEDSEKVALPEHLERFLGRIARGWSDHLNKHAIQVACFDDQPKPGITTYVTLGLSDVVLPLKAERTIRQELVFSAESSVSGDDVAKFLTYFAEKIRIRNRALLRGEVFDLMYPLISGATVTALYATNPTPFDDRFFEFSNVFPPIIFVLLIPVTEKEKYLINNRGWNWFEEMIEIQDPNIWDLNRDQEIS